MANDSASACWHDDPAHHIHPPSATPQPEHGERSLVNAKACRNMSMHLCSSEVRRRARRLYIALGAHSLG